ncbi:MAG: hypothetical protein H7840_15450 [Alphaproteobacteria bacterium]
MTDMTLDIQATIRGACSFEPTAIVVYGALSVEGAFGPGKVTMVVPVPRGNAVNAFHDPVPQGVLDVGGVVILAFQRRKDARLFEALVDRDARKAGLKRPTHSAPARAQ